MTFTPEAEDRIAAAVREVEGSTPHFTPRPKRNINRQTQRLVKLTVKLANAKIWEAVEVYLDTDGEPVEITGGASFSGSVIVMTVTKAKVDDLVLVLPKYRPDGTVFWVGGSSGSGGGGSFIAKNKTQVDGTSLVGTAEITVAEDDELIGDTVDWQLTEVSLGWVDLDEIIILHKVADIYYADASFAILRGSPQIGSL